MATIPTQNAVPSEAPRDLKFNSGKIDEFVTSLEHEYKDRFGRCHMTIEGMRWIFDQLMARFKVDIDQAIIAAGYIPMDSFQQGAEITKRNEILRDETTGEYYRWDGDLPKTVPAGSTPESAGGVGMGAWVSVGDASLRSELSKPTGAGLVSTESGKTVQESLDNVFEIVEGNMVNSNEYNVLSNNLFSPFGCVGILITGQSLAEGGVGYDICPAIQSTLNANAYTLSGGPVGVTDKILGSRLNNINEPVRATIASTMCDRILTNGIAGKTIFSGQAWGGKAYKDVRKGGSTGVYEKCVSQVSDVVKNIKTVEYRAVVFIHGEQDGVDNNQSYATNLGEWIADFNVDIRNATGQSASIPAYFCQTASAGGYGHNGGISDMSFPTPLQQLKAHINNPLLTLVTSKYHLKYYDHAHLTNESQGVLGEYYAKAVSHYEITGTKFEPCRPVSFDKNGNQIIIKFTGTEDGIAIDTDRVNAATNYGFDYTDNSGNTIVSVAVDGVDTVILTLSGTVASGAVVAYAYHNGLGGSDSQKSGYGDRGNIRGTSKFISKVTGEKLHPWCVIFREDI